MMKDLNASRDSQTKQHTTELNASYLYEQQKPFK